MYSRQLHGEGCTDLSKTLYNNIFIILSRSGSRFWKVQTANYMFNITFRDLKAKFYTLILDLPSSPISNCRLARRLNPTVIEKWFRITVPSSSVTYLEEKYHYISYMSVCLYVCMSVCRTVSQGPLAMDLKKNQ